MILGGTKHSEASVSDPTPIINLIYSKTIDKCTRIEKINYLVH